MIESFCKEISIKTKKGQNFSGSICLNDNIVKVDVQNNEGDKIAYLFGTLEKPLKKLKIFSIDVEVKREGIGTDIIHNTIAEVKKVFNTENIEVWYIAGSEEGYCFMESLKKKFPKEFKENCCPVRGELTNKKIECGSKEKR